MSFDIDWDKLVSDDSINESIRDFLDGQFQSFELPSFINDLKVSDFNLGNSAPDISIIHIGDPFDEFYDENLKDIDERLKNLNMDYLKRSNSYDGSSSEEEYHNDHDDASANFSLNEETTSRKPTVLEFPKIAGRSGSELAKQEALPSRSSLDSLSLMLGNNNFFLHNHNINNLGIGNHPQSHSSTRADTPTRFIHLVGKTNLFRDYSGGLMKSLEPAKHKGQNDIQFIVEFKYHGNLEIVVMVNLLVNYPSPRFITLPIKLQITDLVIHSIAVLAYLKKSVFISFLCDINELASDYFSSSHSGENGTPGHNSGGNFVDYINANTTQERIDIIKKVKIESEIGEVENNVLRNVGKVEKFLIDRLRGLLRDEIAWPSWVCLDLGSDDEENENDDNEQENAGADLSRTASPLS